MFGAFYAGQAYPGQSGGFAVAVSLIVENAGVAVYTDSVTLVVPGIAAGDAAAVPVTSSNVDLIVHYVLSVQDALVGVLADSGDPLLLGIVITPQNASVGVTADSVPIYVLYQPQPPAPRIDPAIPNAHVRVVPSPIARTIQPAQPLAKVIRTPTVMVRNDKPRIRR